MKKMFKLVTVCSILLMPIMFMPTTGHSADVRVYAEGAYSDSGAPCDDLVIYLYADIDGSEAILSHGVKLTYDSSKVTVTDADKNEAVWYFGDTSTKYPYMDPDTSTAGEVIIIGGRLDISDPTAGIDGDRVLLGKVTFSNTGGTWPTTDPETFFGLGIGLAKGGDYDNFVTVNGDPIEGTAELTFDAITVCERGDGDTDGLFTNSDYFAVKGFMTSGIYKVYGDCDCDELITNSDYFCIKGKM